MDTEGGATVLYSFSGGTDGQYPQAGVIRDSAGNLYGTTESGGAFGEGVVFQIDPAGGQSVLYNFGSRPGGGTGGLDGSGPVAGVIRDAAGNLYGTCFAGGTQEGVVFELDPAGIETVLYNFTGPGGQAPTAGLTRDSAGNLYGTTLGGGSAELGVVFKLDATGQETVLYNFPGARDGSGWGQISTASLTLDSEGNLYGTTSGGDNVNQGVVFKLSPSGKETLLHSFTGGADGGVPLGSVVLDPAGNVYGTAQYGGASGIGVVFKIDSLGNQTVLHSFARTDGAYPAAGVILDSEGNCYGTTEQGGAFGYGVVFELDPLGNETVLHSFTGGSDGRNPLGSVLRDPAGNLYGTTSGGGTPGGCDCNGCGVVYKVDPSGNQTVLHAFAGADGSFPSSNLVSDSEGNLFGTASRGGASGNGVVFKLDPVGNLTVLHSFAGGSDGASPYSGLTIDSAGNLYGTCPAVGQYGGGVVFSLDPVGNETVVYSFQGFQPDPGGSEPFAGVTNDSFGNLYGTTLYGGAGNVGVVFKLALRR